MEIGKILYNLLSADSALTTLMGTNKVYPSFAPDKTEFPFIVYKTRSADPVVTKNGIADNVTFIAYINVYSRKYDTLRDITDAVKNRINNYSGTVEGVTVKRIGYLDEEEFFDFDIDVHFIELSYRIKLEN